MAELTFFPDLAGVNTTPAEAPPENTARVSEQLQFDEVLRHASQTRSSQPKPVELVLMFNKKGEINFLLKKAWLLLHDYAVQQGLLQDLEKRRFRALVRQLRRDIAYDSHNDEHLKQTLLNAMETSVSWGPSARTKKGERIEWQGTALLSDCKFILISNNLYIDWSYSDVLMAQLRSDGAYFRLRLSAVRKARSLSALNLYLLCERFRTNHNGLSTKYIPVEVYEALSGKLLNEVERNQFQFKYFKRDMLGPAIAEVNSWDEGFKVGVHLERSGRSIAWVQFVVSEDKQPLSSATKVALETRLASLGVDEELAHSACRYNSVEALEAAAQRLEERISKQPSLANVPAYFRSLLDLARKGELAAKARPTPELPQPPSSTVQEETYEDVLASVRDTYLKSTDSSKAYFKGLSEEDRAELLNRFKLEVVDVSGNTSLARTFARPRGPETPLVAVQLFPWIQKRGFTYEPTELEVVRYGISCRLLKS